MAKKQKTERDRKTRDTRNYTRHYDAAKEFAGEQAPFLAGTIRSFSQSINDINKWVKTSTPFRKNSGTTADEKKLVGITTGIFKATLQDFKEGNLITFKNLNKKIGDLMGGMGEHEFDDTYDAEYDDYDEPSDFSGGGFDNELYMQGTAISTQATIDAVSTATDILSNAQIRASDYSASKIITGTNVAISRVLKYQATQLGLVNTLNNNMQSLVEMTSKQEAYHREALQFFQRTEDTLNDIVEMMREQADPAEARRNARYGRSRRGNDDNFLEDGFDIKKYAKSIWKNSMGGMAAQNYLAMAEPYLKLIGFDVSNLTEGAMASMGGGWNGFRPLVSLFNMTPLAKQLQNLNKSTEDLTKIFFHRLSSGEYKTGNANIDELIQAASSFGLFGNQRLGKYESVRLGNYDKGVQKITGKTLKAIEMVVPTYLSNIENDIATLVEGFSTGQFEIGTFKSKTNKTDEEREADRAYFQELRSRNHVNVYDYEKGTFVDSSVIVDELQDNIDSLFHSSMRPITNKISDILDQQVATQQEWDAINDTLSSLLVTYGNMRTIPSNNDFRNSFLNQIQAVGIDKTKFANNTAMMNAIDSLYDDMLLAIDNYQKSRSEFFDSISNGEESIYEYLWNKSNERWKDSQEYAKKKDITRNTVLSTKGLKGTFGKDFNGRQLNYNFRKDINEEYDRMQYAIERSMANQPEFNPDELDDDLTNLRKAYDDYKNSSPENLKNAKKKYRHEKAKFERKYGQAPNDYEDDSEFTSLYAKDGYISIFGKKIPLPGFSSLQNIPRAMRRVVYGKREYDEWDNGNQTPQGQGTSQSQGNSQSSQGGTSTSSTSTSSTQTSTTNTNTYDSSFIGPIPENQGNSNNVNSAAQNESTDNESEFRTHEATFGAQGPDAAVNEIRQNEAATGLNLKLFTNPKIKAAKDWAIQQKEMLMEMVSNIRLMTGNSTESRLKLFGKEGLLSKLGPISAAIKGVEKFFFGEKDEDGYYKGGLVGPEAANKLVDARKSLHQKLFGGEYTDYGGELHEAPEDYLFKGVSEHVENAKDIAYESVLGENYRETETYQRMVPNALRLKGDRVFKVSHAVDRHQIDENGIAVDNYQDQYDKFSPTPHSHAELIGWRWHSDENTWKFHYNYGDEKDLAWKLDSFILDQPGELPNAKATRVVINLINGLEPVEVARAKGENSAAAISHEAASQTPSSADGSSEDIEVEVMTPENLQENAQINDSSDIEVEYTPIESSSGKYSGYKWDDKRGCWVYERITHEDDKYHMRRVVFENRTDKNNPPNFSDEEMNDKINSAPESMSPENLQENAHANELDEEFEYDESMFDSPRERRRRRRKGKSQVEREKESVGAKLKKIGNTSWTIFTTALGFALGGPAGAIAGAAFGSGKLAKPYKALSKSLLGDYKKNDSNTQVGKMANGALNIAKKAGNLAITVLTTTLGFAFGGPAGAAVGFLIGNRAFKRGGLATKLFGGKEENGDKTQGLIGKLFGGLNKGAKGINNKLKQNTPDAGIVPRLLGTIIGGSLLGVPGLFLGNMGGRVIGQVGHNVIGNIRKRRRRRRSEGYGPGDDFGYPYGYYGEDYYDEEDYEPETPRFSLPSSNIPNVPMPENDTDTTTEAVEDQTETLTDVINSGITRVIDHLETLDQRDAKRREDEAARLKEAEQTKWATSAVQNDDEGKKVHKASVGEDDDNDKEEESSGGFLSKLLSGGSKILDILKIAIPVAGGAILLSNFFKTPVGQQVKEKIGGFIEGLGSWLGKMLGKAGKWLLEEIKNIDWKAVIDTGVSIVKGIFNGIANFWDEITHKRDKQGRKRRNFFDTLFGKQYNYTWNEETQSWDEEADQDLENSTLEREVVNVGANGAKALVGANKAIGYTGKNVINVGLQKAGEGGAKLLNGIKEKMFGKITEKGGQYIEGLGQKVAAANAEGVVKEEGLRRVKQIIEGLKTGIDGMIAKFKLKFIEKAGTLSETARSKAIGLLDDLKNRIAKALSNSKFIQLIKEKSKKLGEELGKIATSKTVGAALYAGFVIDGVVSGGAWDARGLFGVEESDVDVEMRLVSLRFSGLVAADPTGIVAIFDLANSLIYTATGLNIKRWLGTIAYTIEMMHLGKFGQEQIEKLKQKQKDYAQDVADYNEATGAELSQADYEEAMEYSKTDFWRMGMEKLGLLSEKDKEKLDAKRKQRAQMRNELNSYQAQKIVESGGQYQNMSVENIAADDDIQTEGYGRSQSVGYGLSNSEHYSQLDNKWKDVNFGQMLSGRKTTIGSGGCGPTSLANVARSITGNKQITPSTVANMAQDYGYTANGGSAASLFTEGANRLGLASQRIRLKDAPMSLAAGNKLIISGKREGPNSLYTDAGHIVSVSGIKGGKAIVDDPLKSHSEEMDINKVLTGAKKVWAIGRKGMGFGDPKDVVSNLASMGYGYDESGNLIKFTPEDNYAAYHDGKSYGTLVDVKGNNMGVFFQQGNWGSGYSADSANAWSSKAFGGTNYGDSGCFPTAFANVFSSITKYDIDPPMVIKKFGKHWSGSNYNWTGYLDMLSALNGPHSTTTMSDYLLDTGFTDTHRDKGSPWRPTGYTQKTNEEQINEAMARVTKTLKNGGGVWIDAFGTGSNTNVFTSDHTGGHAIAMYGFEEGDGETSGSYFDRYEGSAYTTILDPGRSFSSGSGVVNFPLSNLRADIKNGHIRRITTFPKPDMAHRDYDIRNEFSGFAADYPGRQGGKGGTIGSASNGSAPVSSSGTSQSSYSGTSTSGTSSDAASNAWKSANDYNGYLYADQLNLEDNSFLGKLGNIMSIMGGIGGNILQTLGGDPYQSVFGHYTSTNGGISSYDPYSAEAWSQVGSTHVPKYVMVKSNMLRGETMPGYVDIGDLDINDDAVLTSVAEDVIRHFYEKTRKAKLGSNTAKKRFYNVPSYDENPDFYKDALEYYKKSIRDAYNNNEFVDGRYYRIENFFGKKFTVPAWITRQAMREDIKNQVTFDEVKDKIIAMKGFEGPAEGETNEVYQKRLKDKYESIVDDVMAQYIDFNTGGTGHQVMLYDFLGHPLENGEKHGVDELTVPIDTSGSTISNNQLLGQQIANAAYADMAKENAMKAAGMGSGLGHILNGEPKGPAGQLYHGLTMEQLKSGDVITPSIIAQMTSGIGVVNTDTPVSAAMNWPVTAPNGLPPEYANTDLGTSAVSSTSSDYHPDPGYAFAGDTAVSKLSNSYGLASVSTDPKRYGAYTPIDPNAFYEGNPQGGAQPIQTLFRDLRKFPPINAERMNQLIDHIAPSDSPLRGMGQDFVDTANLTGIDPRAIITWAQVESSSGISRIARDKGNLFGINAVDGNAYNGATTFKRADGTLDWRYALMHSSEWLSRNFVNRRDGAYDPQAAPALLGWSDYHIYGSGNDYYGKPYRTAYGNGYANTLKKTEGFGESEGYGNLKLAASGYGDEGVDLTKNMSLNRMLGMSEADKRQFTVNRHASMKISDSRSYSPSYKSDDRYNIELKPEVNLGKLENGTSKMVALLERIATNTGRQAPVNNTTYNIRETTTSNSTTNEGYGETQIRHGQEKPPFTVGKQKINNTHTDKMREIHNLVAKGPRAY